jgi:hypothetical protein
VYRDNLGDVRAIQRKVSAKLLHEVHQQMSLFLKNQLFLFFKKGCLNSLRSESRHLGEPPSRVIRPENFQAAEI